MEHSPVAIRLTVEPVTVHTLGVVLAKLTPSPDVALAEIHARCSQDDRGQRSKVDGLTFVHNGWCGVLILVCSSVAGPLSEVPRSGLNALIVVDGTVRRGYLEKGGAAGT